MEFEKLVEGFAAKVNEPGLRPDDDGAVTIENDRVCITVQDVPELGKVMMHCALGESPAENAAALERKMLEANFMYRGTAGATLSRDGETGRYYLCRCDDIVAMDVEGFCGLIESFLELSAAWRGACEGILGAAIAEPKGDAAAEVEDLADLIRV